MMSFGTLALVFCAGVAAASPATRIVGGSATTIDQYPSLVQVDYWNVWTRTWDQACAGNVLSMKYVLSAAHCFDGILYLPSYRRIRAGSTFRNTGGIIVNVEREFNNPNYGMNGVDGDISVILLAESLEYSMVIQQATIISHGSAIPYNMPVVAAGWGATAFQGSPSEQLQDVIMFSIDTQLCTERYSELGYVVTNNMICHGILDVGGRDACQRDSGGGLFYGNLLVGVISWGEDCGHERYPGVSTKIASYTDWILMTAV